MERLDTRNKEVLAIIGCPWRQCKLPINLYELPEFDEHLYAKGEVVCPHCQNEVGYTMVISTTEGVQ